MEHHIVSVDTSTLCPLGVITVSLMSSSGGQLSQPSLQLRLKGATLRHYREECDLTCYVCKLGADRGRPVTTSAAADAPCPDVLAAACPAAGAVRPDSMAFLMHTSGTTGRPKLVRVPHCSIVPNIVDLRSRFNVDPDDIIFNAAPLTFDPSIVEVKKGWCDFIGSGPPNFSWTPPPSPPLFADILGPVDRKSGTDGA